MVTLCIVTFPKPRCTHEQAYYAIAPGLAVGNALLSQLGEAMRVGFGSLEILPVLPAS
jgi:hypothetical protein